MNLERTDALTQAVKLAQERGLLPSWMGSAELQELALRLRERAFFSARTTNAWYLEKLKALVERYTRGEGRDNDLAQLRVEARELLARAGYTPEKGFPGDEELGIPPAEPGSLKDLGSEKRLNLILNTQRDMMNGLGKKLRGLTRVTSHPAWELVRVLSSRVPREWLERWKTAAENIDWQGVSRAALDGGRMVALKTSPMWPALGSAALFADALNVDHPPFAFNSGMGWRELRDDEARDLGLDANALDAQQVSFLNGLVLSEEQRRFLNVPAPQPAAALSDAERAAKLAKYQRLKAKFDAIDRAAGKA